MVIIVYIRRGSGGSYFSLGIPGPLQRKKINKLNIYLHYRTQSCTIHSSGNEVERCIQWIFLRIEKLKCMSNQTFESLCRISKLTLGSDDMNSVWLIFFHGWQSSSIWTEYEHREQQACLVAWHNWRTAMRYDTMRYNVTQHLGHWPKIKHVRFYCIFSPTPTACSLTLLPDNVNDDRSGSKL